MPTTGKMYFGSTLIAEPGLQWEYDRPYPPDYGTNSTYTIPGTLLQTFTASGTFDPSTYGVTTVHVAVIGGGNTGGLGDGGTSSAANWVGGGGAGGEVCVYRNVPVSGPVAVTIGGANTASAFGTLEARSAALNAAGFVPGQSYNPGGRSHGSCSSSVPGRDGVQVNGTYYAGGGGGKHGQNSYTVGSVGGAGGGGTGGGGSPEPTPGTNGLGGGGGGKSYNAGSGGLGGSGRVMIWSEDV